MTKLYSSKIGKLSKEEFEITQNCGTEKAFENKYWDNKAEGIYVDIITGEPLFSSMDKYDSKTGWPSFTGVINKKSIIEAEDLSYNLKRTEVKTTTSHLGHLFEDGPAEQGGLRYCINSASLRFIAKDKLVESGYGEYLRFFSNEPIDKPEFAYLAGGCFWGLEYLMSKAEGVISTRVGYCGGDLLHPIYEQVSSGDTGHAETVEVQYDPSEITYREILKLFFTIHNPTTLNQQGNDKGTQYRSEIFYTNDTQRYAALDIIKLANESDVFGGAIVTNVSKFKHFYEAENYHQKYLEQNPAGYNCHFVRNNWKF
jgi:peptide methionine sulfoxide reductase msrA/msrB